MPSDPTAVAEQVHNLLLEQAASIDHMADTHPGEPRLAELVRQVNPLLGPAELAATVSRVRARMAGIGTIEHLMADPDVTDILVNGPGPVWVERRGRLEQTDAVLDGGAIGLLIERSLGPLGLRADRADPVVDARLPDGSRLHVVLPPLAVDGPYVAIRRFATDTLPLSLMCAEPVATLLRWALAAGQNMIVCGGTGSGKTTLLNSLCHHLPPHERVVTVEDAAELRLPGDHVVRLEARPATPDGVGAQTIRDLVRTALRMRPDRLIVGEVRGAEALDLLQALNTGHHGGLSTCHANSPEDGLRRLETMCSLGTASLPLDALREQMTAAIDLLVQVRRQPDGTRGVVAVAEVMPNPRAGRRARMLVCRDQALARPRRPARRHDAPEVPTLWPLSCS